ncbi:MAG: FMN-binding protein [Firmicutes bacterium]|nr:FMN-binding protein [Bacillota bacterium]
MNKTIQYAIRLLIICAVATLVLAYTNSQTAPVIAERQKQETIAAYKKVFPDAEEVQPVGDDSLLNKHILDIQEAKVGGETKGYIFNVESPSGYDGPVTYVVGVTTDGAVTGFQVISQTETKGFGAAVADEAYAQAMVGSILTGEIKRGESAGESTIPGLSGATKTTNAVLGGMNEVSRVLGQLSGSEAK